jgi:excisionase family DNA binding protein
MTSRPFADRIARRQPKANDFDEPGRNRPGASLHDVRAVARRFGVCDKTVRRLIVSGKLKAHRVGRQIRVEEAGVVRFLQKNFVIGEVN